MAVLQAMASEVYHAQGDDQKALPYIEKAYEIDKQSGNEGRAIVRLAQKASVLIGLHNYQEAEKTLKEVIPFLRQTPDRQSLGIALNKLGMALLSQKREQEAVPYYQEAADIFQQLGDPYNEVHARRGLYESLWKQNPDEAKLQLDRFNDLKDSIYNNVSADKLAKYNAEFGNDWLQIENHEQRQAKWWAILAAIIAVMLAVAIWFWMRYRHQKQIRINAELSERIKELREKYDMLNEQYDNALTTGNHDDGPELDATDNEFLSKTINVINELILTGQIDANHVAERLGLSLYQFRQRLATLTDETPQSFIQTIRMRRARHLLDNHPEMNISEVAMLCAYNDTPNFTRAFKRTFGITPTQYLEKQQ
jgi:AraC-like DNA-binding protein